MKLRVSNEEAKRLVSARPGSSGKRMTKGHASEKRQGSGEKSKNVVLSAEERNAGYGNPKKKHGHHEA